MRQVLGIATDAKLSDHSFQHTWATIDNSPTKQTFPQQLFTSLHLVEYCAGGIFASAQRDQLAYILGNGPELQTITPYKSCGF